MVNTNCPRKYRYFSSFEDLLKKRQMDNEINEKNSNIPQICTNLLNLPGPYTSAETMDKSFNLLSCPINIQMKVNMGDSYNNTTTYGLLQAGQGSQCNGNLYVWVSAGRITFGVQCNGKNSDISLNSQTNIVANTTYDLKLEYDGNIASIYINGKLDASAVKNFNYLANVEKVTIGAGNFNKTTEVMPNGASISNILMDKCTTKPKCENNCKKCKI